MLPFGTAPAGLPVRTFDQQGPVVAPTGSDIMAPQIYGGSNALFSRQLENQVAKQANFFVRTCIVHGAPHYWLNDPIEEPGSYPGFMAPRLLRFLQERL